MRNILLLFVLVYACVASALAQTDTVAFLTKHSYMIPMRDGVKLFTVILSPVNYARPVPILMERTPYGANFPLKDDSDFSVNLLPAYYRNMLKAGYIMVFQDIRGKFGSEGQFEMNRPLYHLQDKTKTDESTDAYDAVDWLVQHVRNNNGKVGIFGIFLSRLSGAGCLGGSPSRFKGQFAPGDAHRYVPG